MPKIMTVDVSKSKIVKTSRHCTFCINYV